MLVGVWSDRVWPNRRTQASIPHNSGESTGAVGALPATEFNPNIDNTLETAVASTFNGASGPSNAAGTACGVTELACDCDSAVLNTCRCWFSVLVNVAIDDAATNGDGALTTLCALSCIGSTENESAAEFAARLKSAAEPSTRDDNGFDISLESDREPPGADCNSCVVPGNGAGAVNVGVVCAPPVLCTVPDFGSPVTSEFIDAVPVATVEPACDVLLGGVGVDDGEPEPEFGGVACVGGTGVGDGKGVGDEPVGGAGCEVGDGPVDDELVSVGSADTTPGVVATATPTPKATAKAPTRPMYVAYPIVPFPCHRLDVGLLDAPLAQPHAGAISR
jgi:hypothetical protein